MFSKVVILCMCAAFASANPLGFNPSGGNNTDCLPDQYSCTILQQTAYAHGGDAKVINMNVAYNYDFKGSRTSVNVNASDFNTIEIILYGKGMKYEIDAKKKSCKSTKIDAKMERACMPDDAKEFGKFDLNGKTVVGFKSTKKDHEAEMEVTTFADVNSTLPVSQTMDGSSRGTKFFTAQLFLNSKESVDEPAFAVPSYCK